MSNPLIKEVIIDAPAEKVWSAITDKNEMKHWYFDLAEFKPEIGFEFSFTGGTEERSYLHLCKVTEVIPGRKLTYSWRYDGFDGISYVTWELFEDKGKTRLVLTHRGLDSFPADINPDLAAHNFVAGWNEILGTSLKNYLENKS